MTPVSKAHALTRLVAKLDRMIALATAASSTITRWRLILFIVGAICTVALYKTGWFQAGNGALIAFVALFLIVAVYHNRLESRVHRLRLWKQIKLVHLARLQLDWLEHLNGFPGDWTAGMSDGKRAFMMGNALVVGLVEKIADELIRDVAGTLSVPVERAAAS